MKQTLIPKISKKRRQKNKEWREVCLQELQQQINERGFNYCEICGASGIINDSWNPLWGHHKDHNRNHNTRDNCEIDHWICHQQKHHG